MNKHNRLEWLIIIATLVRCWLAITVELGNDEVYYLTYARHLQWNYFDHPPMVAILIRITTLNLVCTGDVFVRLGPIILAAINTWLIYKTVKKLHSPDAGFVAALLFTASPYCSVIAGTFIMPDAPHLFFYILSVSLLTDVIKESTPAGKRNVSLLLFGLISGLCIMSKVHGVFLWLGFFVYIFLYKRALLQSKYLYAGALITVLIVSPIFFWNLRNSFITFTFHRSRVIPESLINPVGLLKEAGGNILYNNPVNFILILLVLMYGRQMLKVCTNRLLLCLALPLILIIWLMSLFRDTLPHWSGPAYVPLIMLAAFHIADQKLISFRRFNRWKKASHMAIGVLIVGLVLGVVIVKYYPGSMGNKNWNNLGDGDATLDMYGWKEAAIEFESLFRKNKEQGITTTSFIISNKWFPGAHIDNYMVQPMGLNFVALGDMADIHTYAWLNEYRKKLQPGDDAYFVTVSNYWKDPAEVYSTRFGHIEKPITYLQYRGGKPARVFFFYLLRNYKGKLSDF